MNDFKGNELAIGDKILYAYATSGYLHEGTIVKFTKLGLCIEYLGQKYDRNTKTFVPELRKTNILGCEARVFKLG